MRLTYEGTFLQPKDLAFCNDITEKDGYIFYRTTFGNLLYAIKSKEINHSLVKAYRVKLSLFEKILGWKRKSSFKRRHKKMDRGEHHWLLAKIDKIESKNLRDVLYDLTERIYKIEDKGD